MKLYGITKCIFSTKNVVTLGFYKFLAITAMESHHQNQQQQKLNQAPIFNNKVRNLKLYIASILILVIAIFTGFVFTNTNNLQIQLVKLTLLSNPTAIFHKFSYPKALTTKPTKTLQPIPSHCVLWMAPFLSGGGYSSEAWSYILALTNHMKGTNFFRLSIEQHGDLESLEFWEGLPQELKTLAFELYQSECSFNETIVVCHSEPGAWYPPLFQTLPCPPTGYGGFISVIGRTMFETDRVNVEHVRRCDKMDYVWVPTNFHVSTFVQSGVDPSKVVKIVQPIDVKFFDPSVYMALDIVSMGKLVFGERDVVLETKKDFVFLSVFKWEYRKGWDVLLKAYLKEFSGVDEVALYLLTNPYHSDRDFGNKIVEFIESSNLKKPDNGWAPIFVIDTHVAQMELPRLYKAANAFVLPSRGEGWGRPIVEAMAMSLPVIATNWSGPTEYLTEENSYPLPVDRMSEVKEGPFKGHLWAEPSVSDLQALMRHVMTNIEEAEYRGKRAREDMIRRFSPEIVAGIVTEHMQNIFQKRQAMRQRDV